MGQVARVKSLGLPPEASAAIDRYWKPVWEALRDELALLPVQARRAAVLSAEQIEFEAGDEARPGRSGSRASR